MPRLLAGMIVLSLMVVALGCSSATPTPQATPTSQAATTTGAPGPATLTIPVTESPVVTPEAFFLEVLGPSDESVVQESSVEVTGNTTVDAVVTVNDQLAEVDEEGKFSTLLSLEEGPNVIEIISSDFSGNQEVRVLTLIYVP